MQKIVSIVEGHGEVDAVPILLRRIVQRVSPTAVLDVPKPIRVKRNRILRDGELERAVALAARRAGDDGSILFLLDSNGDCPAEFGPQILRRATAARSDRAIRVVLAKMEFEAWFLAAAPSLGGRRGIDEDIARPADPEAVRDAKGWLSKCMPPGQPYRETLHQAALAATFDLDLARSAPSFNKLWRDIESLIPPKAVT
ncbi:MAG: DUF4276 family protein [Alphaproteobacteria bacterium]|nr:DUF4276 family protein [Alphaproteobacteria bacterium]